MLGVAGVVLGSYCAMASNSATMTVTATIAHDVSLGGVTELNVGTITVNPASHGNCHITYDSNGTLIDAYTCSATSATPGTFTANIANPEGCNGTSYACSGLRVTNEILNPFGGDSGDDYCHFYITYDSGNRFKVFPYNCYIEDMSQTEYGLHTHTNALTISYTAS